MKYIYSMKFLITCSFILLGLTSLFSQYTDQINSNRPGISIGAFAVGKNVVQLESGFAHQNYLHSGYNKSTFNAGISFLSVRWGFLFERLELTYQGAYLKGTLTSKLATEPTSTTKKGFTENFLGLKFLLYDPYKKEEKINVYSWKANNRFKLRDLLPAVSLTAGANAQLGKEQPYPYRNYFAQLYRPVFYQNIGVPLDQEPFLHFRATLATQNHFLRTWVLVTNLSYQRILSDYPEKNYIVTLTHTLNPLWSIYLENEGRYSDLFRNNLVRGGAAYLWSDDLQIEATVGANTKNTPGMLFINAGVSYRLDFHKDFQTAAELEAKSLNKQEKQVKKAIRKDSKTQKKRNKKAKRKN